MENLRSPNAITALSSSSHDRHGNVVINGRIKKVSTFDIHSALKSNSTEYDLSVIICRQDKKSGCKDNGLVLCYPTPDNYIFNDKFTDDSYEQLKDICDEMNGFMVSTEVDPASGIDVFKIVTRFGNTYKTQIPENNCIVLWLTSDFYLKNNSQTFLEQSNYKVNAIWQNSETANMNNSIQPLLYTSNWLNVAEALDETLIKMHSRQPGRPLLCNNSKNYGRSNFEMLLQMVGQSTECDYPYTIGINDVTKMTNSSVTVDGMSESEENEREEMLGKHEYKELHVSTARSKTRESLDAMQDKIQLDEKVLDQIILDGKLGGEMPLPIPVPGLQVNVGVELEAAYEKHMGTKKIN
uniref:Uncharacterized protein n=1 Tax=Ditylenchus dipsaci TaxID=166011 RepID=A0A915E3B0_9BILA